MVLEYGPDPTWSPPPYSPTAVFKMVHEHMLPIRRKGAACGCSRGSFSLPALCVFTSCRRFLLAAFARSPLCEVQRTEAVSLCRLPLPVPGHPAARPPVPQTADVRCTHPTHSPNSAVRAAEASVARHKLSEQAEPRRGHDLGAGEAAGPRRAVSVRRAVTPAPTLPGRAPCGGGLAQAAFKPPIC